MKQAEKFIQELAWHEFYTRTWFQKGDQIFEDIRHPQEGVENHGIPEAVLKASGHADNFADPVVSCKKCNSRFRADHLLSENDGVKKSGIRLD